MKVAGLSGTKAFNMSVGYMGMGFVCTCLSWLLISKYGRRPIYNIGLAFLTLIMFIIAFLDLAPNYENRPAVIWAQSSLLVSQNWPSLRYHPLLQLYSPSHHILYSRSPFHSSILWEI